MANEGYIKFNAIWLNAPASPASELSSLAQARQEMFDLGLIGAYPNGIGYGNISQRIKDSNKFYITGSATGHLSDLTPDHFSIVENFDIPKNSVHCSGPIIASSESMSHAVIYQACPEVNTVIHIHHLPFWNFLLGKVPTTDIKATYGTPEMALSILELLQKTQLRKEKIFVMEGHKEGIFTFGTSFQEAKETLLFWKKKVVNF